MDTAGNNINNSSNKNRKRKKRKVRVKAGRGHIFVTLIMFLGMMLLIGGTTLISMSLYINNIIDLKLSGKTETFQKIAETYDNSAEGESDPLAEYCTDYFVTDKAGKAVLIKGRDTCNRTAELTHILCDGKYSDFRILTDSEDEIVTADGDVTINIDLTKLSDEVQKQLDSNSNSLLLTIFGGVDSRNKFIDMSFWASTKVKDGGETLFFKTVITANAHDIVNMLRMASIVLVFCMLMFIVIMTNIIGSMISRKHLVKLYYTDNVTGGRNKAWYLYKGDSCLRSVFNAKKLYAVYSLDYVNYLNFCVCHSISDGEKLLGNICSAINKEVVKGKRGSRKNLCVHYNSSDIAVLARVTDDASVRESAQRIMDAASAASGDYKPAFHIGVFTVGYHTDKKGRIKRRKYADIEEYYNSACTAREVLDGSEDSGIVYYDEKLFEEQKWISTVHERQQSALDNEEFLVYYQPKYDPRTNKLKGAEALIRWQSPEFGFITPYKFIPIFEKNGFITQIDHYMITRVARDQKRWLDLGMECVPVSVNVSRAHFGEPDLADQIRDMVDREGAPHRLIEIELTESAFFDDKKAMIATINKLKEYGFTVSMDDFGSGYSSLNSLKDMPLDVLKLDAEFFRGDNADERGRIVVAEAIKLARSLNMRTVAEGVEIKEQVDFLADQDCDMIQGYYYAKPMPPVDYEKRMTDGGKVRLEKEENKDQ